jgi:hypothetical protein
MLHVVPQEHASQHLILQFNFEMKYFKMRNIYTPTKKDRKNEKRDRQSTYVEVRSCNHCCYGKATSTAHSECVFTCCNLARKLHLFCAALCCHLWPVWLYWIFRHYLAHSKIFRKQITEQQMCFDFPYTFSLQKNFPLHEEFSTILS